MYKKNNKKQINTNKILYLKRLKLTHQTTNQHHKKKPQSYINSSFKQENGITTKPHLYLSQSVNLNDSIIRKNRNVTQQTKQQKIKNFFLNNQEKIFSLTPSSMTPYQMRKADQVFISKNKSIKKQLSFISKQQNSKEKMQRTISSVGSFDTSLIKKRRTDTFFKSYQKKPDQNDETKRNYSQILKSGKKSVHEQQFLQSIGCSSKVIQDSLRQTINLQKNVLIKIIDLKDDQCFECQRKKYNKEKQFFKNEEIKKNIEYQENGYCQNIQNGQNGISFKHFPEIQVLNNQYFSKQYKNKLMKRINSNNLLNHYNKMKIFLTKSKQSPIIQRCKSCQKHKIRLNKKFFGPSNFQYFVYQYKTSGNTIQTQKKSTQKSFYPKMYLKKRVKTENINTNHQKEIIKSLSFSSTFQNFIHHKKIDVPLRSYTSALKQAPNSRDNFIRKNSPKKPFQSSKGAFCQENFVKPWQNSQQLENFL